MKLLNSPTVRRPMLLSAALVMALSACARDDKSANDTAAAASSGASAAASSDAAMAGHEGMAGMEGTSAASVEMHRIMEEAKAMPMTMSGDVDKDFATMMTMHHQTAIKMIDVFQQNGQSQELKSLATKMKSDQQAEIKSMAPFAAAAPGAAAMPGHEGMAGMEGKNAGSAELDRIMKANMAMPMAMSVNVDKDFASMMTMHHEAAIKMVDVLLKNGNAADLKTMAGKMKSAQQDEIKQLASYMK